MSSRRAQSIVAVVIVAVAFCCLAPTTHAEEAFYRVPVSELKLLEGEIPKAAPDRVDRDPFRGRIVGPRVIVDGDRSDVEAYAAPADDERANWSWGVSLDQWAVYVRAPQARELSGRFVFPRPDGADGGATRFTIPASAADPSNRARFFRAKALYYERLLSQDVPGAAWFRQQARLARREAGDKETDEQQQQRRFVRSGNLDDTYGLYTGGRAVAENLQLDRALPPSNQPQDLSVPIESIDGVTVREMDWKPLIKDLKPAFDPLASKIPADQPAIFFPSVAEAVAVLETAEKQAVPAIQTIEPQNQTINLRQRYEKQLGVTIAQLKQLADKGLIKSLAVTASDPYVRAGTDLAIVFETSDAGALKQALSGPAEAATPDRTVSAFIEVIGDDAVALTNSREQFRRLASMKSKPDSSLARLPEYTFFRDRYRRGEGEESAFVVLSDATIRRWCGPRWRIGDSRRTRAAAVLADLQAAHLEAIARRGGELPSRSFNSDRFVPNLGELKLTPVGVRSDTYNTLAFLTPISELPIDKVSPAEKEAYVRWRDGYQRNWSWAFDPIALRISVRPGRIAGDVTVMPLIDASRYRELISTSRGATIKPGSGDPHPEAIAHVSYAINVESEAMREASQTLTTLFPQFKVNPLDWLGQTVAVYADADPFWQRLAEAKDKERFFMREIGNLPIGVYAQVRQPVKLAGILAAARGFVEGAAPNLLTWSTPQHNGRAYVKVTANLGQMLGGDSPPPFGIYYATSPDSFTLSLNEDLLKRAIDRQVARASAASQPSGGAPATQPWLGSNLALRVDRRFIDVTHLMDFEGNLDQDPRWRMQRLAWANIPILNEWKRLFPDRDPLAVHEQLWQVRLLDPAGGSYAWNDQWQTMESSTYGHPAQPKPGPPTPPMLDTFQLGDFGVDFETQGIRARAVLTTK